MATYFVTLGCEKNNEKGLDFIVDMITKLIVNVVSGDSFATDISLLNNSDLKTVSKKNKWRFNRKEAFLQPERDMKAMFLFYQNRS